MLPLLLLLAAVALPEKPAQYVTDRAGVFDKERAAALNAKLAQFDRDTSTQILVYVDRKLPPETSIEEMGAEAMRKWGVGQKGKDNGAILFIFTEERKMRIEVGYGLEPVLTDAKSKRITSTILKPALQAGQYTVGIEKGVDAMMAVARGEDFGGGGKRSSTTVSAWWIVLLPIGLALFVIGIILWLINRNAPRGRAAMSSSLPPTDALATAWVIDSTSSSSWSDSDSSSSSSSSSDDSFSGGGGSGGGGGASDSW